MKIVTLFMGNYREGISGALVCSVFDLAHDFMALSCKISSNYILVICTVF